MKSIKKNNSALSAAYVVIIAIGALITVPFGPVPFTLQTFSITLIAFIATPRQATIAIITYILLGAIGVPIFSSMRGGIGVLIGPTGGFLIGYALTLPFITLACNKLKSKLSKTPQMLAYLLLGILMTGIAYTIGTAQYMIVANVSFAVALTVTVVPFVLIDLTKIAVALAFSLMLNKHL